MANKTHGGLYVAIGLILMGTGAYYLWMHSKQHYAAVISKAGHGTYDNLMGFDKKYLKEYANAVKNNADTFMVDGKVFDGKTGRAKR